MVNTDSQLFKLLTHPTADFAMQAAPDAAVGNLHDWYVAHLESGLC